MIVGGPVRKDKLGAILLLLQLMATVALGIMSVAKRALH